MNRFTRSFLTFSMLAGPVFAQSDTAVNDAAARARDQAKALAQQARSVANVAGAYDAGTRALDDHRYEDAIQYFDRVIAAKSEKTEGALYWKAYALNRLGRRDDALAAIATLRQSLPASHWLNDAQALEVEARQNSGKPVSPADESNDDLKLIAINGLMKADPDRAVPLLEGVLKGPSPPNVKDRAMFVLTQSRSPQALQALTDYAKGSANPDLQIRAIRYIGMIGTAEGQQQLLTIFKGTSDKEIKKAIVRSMTTSRASAGGTAALTGVYGTESDPEVKREIVNSLAGRGDAHDLVDLARKETDPAMKKSIVERLSAMGNNKEAIDYMMELLK